MNKVDIEATREELRFVDERIRALRVRKAHIESVLQSVTSGKPVSRPAGRPRKAASNG